MNNIRRYEDYGLEEIMDMIQLDLNKQGVSYDWGPCTDEQQEIIMEEIQEHNLAIVPVENELFTGWQWRSKPKQVKRPYRVTASCVIHACSETEARMLWRTKRPYEVAVEEVDHVHSDSHVMRKS